MVLATERSENVQCPQMPESGIYGSSGSPFFHWTHWTSLPEGYLNQTTKKFIMKKLNIEKMRDLASFRGGRCLSDSYINCETHLLWECSKGHNWKAMPLNVKRGTWCPVCYKLDRFGVGSPSYGKSLSAETKQKISDTLIKNGLLKGRKLSDECRGRISETRKKMFASGDLKPITYWHGKHMSEEHKKRMSETKKKMFTSGELASPWKGKKLSEEHRKKLSLSHKGIGLGRKLPDSVKEKISLANTGKTHTYKPRSEDHAKKLSMALTGKKLSMAHIEKLRSSHIGKKHTTEHKEKIRMARLNQIFPTRDTKIEVLLQKAILEKGIFFKTHVPLLGQPDIFIEPNICIFADGCYWHGCECCVKGGENPIFYHRRIEDGEISENLINKNYVVLRFWEHDIKNNLQSCVSKVLQAIDKNGGD